MADDNTVVTPHQDNTRQAAQAVEGGARETSKAIPPGETAAALGDTFVDADPSTRTAPAPQSTDDTPPPVPPPVRGKYDEKRAEIRARFREHRGEQNDDNTDQISDFVQEGMPPDFVQAEPQDGDTVTEPAPEPQDGEPPVLPKTIRLKVHGKEIDLPLDEVVKNAQIALASDNILDKAKSKLGEIDQLYEQVRSRAQQSSPGGQQANPNGQQTEQPTEPLVDPNQDDGKKFVEAIQFGDPEEAQRLFNEEVTRRVNQTASKTVAEQLLNQRMRDEGARAMKVLNDFTEKHSDVANDPRARAVIEQETLRLQAEDLVKIGLDPAKIRPDGQPATAGDIANAHKFYRAEGFAVRSPADLLETAFTEYQTWRGVKKQPDQDSQQQPIKAAPRVAVSVERQERRQQVQPQPSRTGTPRQIQPAPPPRDRSQIVNDMKASRALKRGSTLGA
jgi:hypothetical protein